MPMPDSPTGLTEPADASLIHVVVSGWGPRHSLWWTADGGSRGQRRDGRSEGWARRGLGPRRRAAAQPPLGAAVRRDARLPGPGRHVHDPRGCGVRAVPLAVRPGVLPGAAGRPAGPGARHRPGRGVGRGPGPSGVRGRVGLPGAAPVDPPRHHPVVPVPQHVRVLDHRPVRRAPRGPGARPRVADRPASHPAPRLRGRAQRPPADRRRGRAARETVLAWNRAAVGGATPPAASSICSTPRPSAPTSAAST